ncbi:hypothetical protein EC912_103302 [Luteibacter rhizovicinus]|uniref:Uncharacterized protein n=1 Tax=Luteibacter rhizovicinus TaxID=242606 RepID=A0A4R3YTZ5_9GAMM|nr:hypothetical protein [Luteibacter rhizovicinus]TCV94814.1 hypothetical protein EC912_103302 [Luteibacter rhizovicinus]
MGKDIGLTDTSPALDPISTPVGPFGVGKPELKRIVEAMERRLEAAYPNDGKTSRQKLRKTRLLAESIAAMDMDGPYTREQLATGLRYFIRAQNVLDPFEQVSVLPDPEARAVSRMMKWHFRSALNEQVKARLDSEFSSLSAHLPEGGERVGSASLGTSYGFEPGASARLFVEAAQTVAGLASKAIQKKTTTSVGVGIGLLKDFVGLDATLGAIRGKTYANLEDYVRAESGKLGAWYHASPLRALANMRSIAALAGSYEKDAGRLAVSRSSLNERLERMGLPADMVKPVGRGAPRPVEYLKVGVASASAKFAFGDVIELKAGVQVKTERGVKTQSMDIVDMYDFNPDLARQRLGSSTSRYADSDDLACAMQAHAREASRLLTDISLGKVDGGAKFRSAAMSESASLLKDYVSLKLAGAIDESADRHIVNLLDQHKSLLRPASVRESIETPSVRNIVALESEANAHVVGQAGVSAKLSLVDVHRHEEPTLRGQFVEVELKGAFNSKGLVANVVNGALGQMGTPVFDVGKLVEDVVNVGFPQEYSQTIKSVFKIKDGQPVLLMHQTFDTERSVTKVSAPVGAGLNIDAGISASDKRVRQAQLGTESLDYLMPLARSKLGKPGPTTWWDDYTKQHGAAFDTLGRNMANPRQGTILQKEMANMMAATPSAQPYLDNLRDAAKRSDSTAMRGAIKEMLREHVVKTYKPEVTKEWTLRKPPLVRSSRNSNEIRTRSRV